MTQLLQPGDVPAWSGDDPPASIDDIFAEETWPAIWPRLVYHFATTAERDAGLAGLGPTDTAAAYVKDINVFFVWGGTAFRPVGGRRANGSVAVASLAQDVSATIAVTFPVGLFTAAPRVMLTSGHSRLTVAYSAITTSGFTITAVNYSSGGMAASSTIAWSAEQL